MQQFIRVNTVCYGKKELQVQKYNIYIFRKVYLTPLIYTMDYPKLVIVSNQKVKIIN